MTPATAWFLIVAVIGWQPSIVGPADGWSSFDKCAEAAAAISDYYTITLGWQQPLTQCVQK